MDWLSKIPNWIKIPIKVLLPSLTLFSGIIMLSSDEFLAKLYLLGMRQEKGFIFGIMFVICLSLEFSYLAVFITEKIINQIRLYKLKKAREKQIGALSPKAYSILLTMYKSNSRVLELEYSDANTAFLVSQHMIVSSQMSTFGTFFSFTLQPWVVEFFDNKVAEYKMLLKRTEKKLLKAKNDESKTRLLNIKDDCQQNIKFLTEKVDSKSIRQEWLGW